MNSKNIQHKLPENEFLADFNKVDFCDVSKASIAIMLERFCNGKEIDFPFSQ